MADKQSFQAALEWPGPILIDGGLATQCESMGCDIAGDLWSAVLLQSSPRAVIDAHRAFLDAGADIIITASYQASRVGFTARGLSGAGADALILSSVTLAAQARQEFLQDNPRTSRRPMIAASIGPFGAALHDGSEYTGRYSVSAAELEDFHASRLGLLDASEADLLACETIPSLSEAKVLAELLRNAKTPAWISFACRDDECIGDGTRLIEAASVFTDHPRVLAVGVNCTAPQHILSLIGHIRSAVPDKAIVVYPNSGETYNVADNSWRGEVNLEDWVTAAHAWATAGAKLIGGCCRVGAEQIRELAEGIAGRNTRR